MLVDNLIGYIGNRLAYFEIRVLSAGKIEDEGEVKETIYQKWENYIQNFRDNGTVPDQIKAVH